MPIEGKRDLLPPFGSLRTLFEAAVIREPGSIALVDVATGETFTFSQLSARVNKLARFLHKLFSQYDKTDNPDGDKVVAVCIPPSIDLIVCLFAILQVKGAYLPLDVDFPAARVNHILEEAKPQLVLVKGQQPAIAHLRTNYIDGVKLIDLDDKQSQIESEDSQTLASGDESDHSETLVAILYTSGSTGVPKGVRLSQRSVLNRLVWQWRTFPYEESEVCCFKTALTFVDSISEIFGPILTGHQLIIIPKSLTREVERLIYVLDKFRVHRLVLVPSLLRSILLHTSRKKDSLPHLRLWICSGETFPPDLLFTFFENFKGEQKICNFYGSTEVLGDVTSIQFTSLDDVVEKLSNNKVPIGKPVSNVDVYLVDAELNEVADGKVGELLIAGLNLANGYVGTGRSDKFIKNPHSSLEGYDILYRTGDFARHINGQLVYEGRTDSQLKIRGHRVDLSEVETCVQGVRGIDKCHIACYRPGEIDQELLAFYTSSDNDVTPKYLKLRISSLLPNYMHPKFANVEEMPLLVNGKIDRQRLLKMHEDAGFQNSLQEAEFDLTGCEEGKEDMAKSLCKALTRVLGPSISKISLDQNFFEIGGNSLNSVLAITAFQDAGYHIGITEFLTAQTLYDILNQTIEIQEEPFTKDSDSKVEVLRRDKLNDYKCHPLQKEYKEDVKRIVARSFATKGDLEVLLKIKENEYLNLIEQIWENILKQNLSFVVCREGEDNILAVSINADLYMEPDIRFPSKNVKYIFDFLNECEMKVKFYLPEGIGKVIHSFIMATEEGVKPGENVTLIRVMEEENLRIAQKRGYEAIFTTNTSELTQHICDDVLLYKALASYQVNQWIAEDGTHPFKSASDAQTAVCSVCFVSERIVAVRRGNR